MAAANPATVGEVNSTRRGTSTPKASRTLATICVARSECPPNSKKLSSRPTPSSRSTDAKMSATARSAGVVGSAPGTPASKRTSSGSGRARRSTLPLGVSGSSGSVTNADGTRYSGTLRCMWVRRSAAETLSPGLVTMYATMRLSPRGSSVHSTRTSRTAGWFRNTASTSPSSIR